jgi:glycosyltransferase involved in cell wall biosynthesis
MNDNLSIGILVSVVIPTYNRREKTVRAINSCLAQTHRTIQVVVVDDGGDSEEFKRLKSEFSHEPKIEFFSTPHCGHPGKVRNLGFQKSNGAWIAFLDSDDYWEPMKLERQLEMAVHAGARALCSNAYIMGEKLAVLDGSENATFTRNDLLTKNSIINSSVLVDRTLLELVGGIVQKANVVGAEDYATWLRISTIANWHYSSDCLIHYDLKSEDSLRFDEELSQLFSRVYAFLDFIEWEKVQNRNSLKLTRFFINFLPRLIKFDFFINQAKSRGKESNQMG